MQEVEKKMKITHKLKSNSNLSNIGKLFDNWKTKLSSIQTFKSNINKRISQAAQLILFLAALLH